MKKPSIFISHSHKDLEWSDWFYGIATLVTSTVFYDRKEEFHGNAVTSKAPLTSKLQQQIEDTDIAIIVASNSYEQGHWGQLEFTAFSERLARLRGSEDGGEHALRLEILVFWIGENEPGAFTSAYGITKVSGRSSENKKICLLYTSPSPRDATLSRMPSSA